MSYPLLDVEPQDLQGLLDAGPQDLKALFEEIKLQDKLELAHNEAERLLRSAETYSTQGLSEEFTGIGTDLEKLRENLGESWDNIIKQYNRLKSELENKEAAQRQSAALQELESQYHLVARCLEQGAISKAEELLNELHDSLAGKAPSENIRALYESRHKLLIDHLITLRNLQEAKTQEQQKQEELDLLRQAHVCIVRGEFECAQTLLGNQSFSFVSDQSKDLLVLIDSLKRKAEAQEKQKDAEAALREAETWLRSVERDIARGSIDQVEEVLGKVAGLKTRLGDFWVLVEKQCKLLQAEASRVANALEISGIESVYRSIEQLLEKGMIEQATAQLEAYPLPEEAPKDLQARKSLLKANIEALSSAQEREANDQKRNQADLWLRQAIVALEHGALDRANELLQTLGESDLSEEQQPEYERLKVTVESLVTKTSQLQSEEKVRNQLRETERALQLEDLDTARTLLEEIKLDSDTLPVNPALAEWHARLMEELKRRTTGAQRAAAELSLQIEKEKERQLVEQATLLLRLAERELGWGNPKGAKNHLASIERPQNSLLPEVWELIEERKRMISIECGKPSSKGGKKTVLGSPTVDMQKIPARMVGFDALALIAELTGISGNAAAFQLFSPDDHAREPITIQATPTISEDENKLSIKGKSEDTPVLPGSYEIQVLVDGQPQGERRSLLIVPKDEPKRPNIREKLSELLHSGKVNNLGLWALLGLLTLNVLALSVLAFWGFYLDRERMIVTPTPIPTLTMTEEPPTVPPSPTPKISSPGVHQEDYTAYQYGSLNLEAELTDHEGGETMFAIYKQEAGQPTEVLSLPASSKPLENGALLVQVAVPSLELVPGEYAVQLQVDDESFGEPASLVVSPWPLDEAVKSEQVKVILTSTASVDGGTWTGLAEIPVTFTLKLESDRAYSFSGQLLLVDDTNETLLQWQASEFATTSGVIQSKKSFAAGLYKSLQLVWLPGENADSRYPLAPVTLPNTIKIIDNVSSVGTVGWIFETPENKKGNSIDEQQLAAGAKVHVLYRLNDDLVWFWVRDAEASEREGWMPRLDIPPELSPFLQLLPVKEQ